MRSRGVPPPLTKEILRTKAPQLIEKCFYRAGFICSVPTAPEPEPERNVCDNIQQILNVQVPFSEYATADDQVEMTERLSEAEIVQSKLSQPS